MSNEADVQAIELSIEQARAMVEKADALDRLMANKDFKLIISEGYFKEEAIRLVELKAAPQMESDVHQTAVLKSIDAIGELQQHFNAIYMMASNAQRAIEDGEAELNAMDEVA